MSTVSPSLHHGHHGASNGSGYAPNSPVPSASAGQHATSQGNGNGSSADATSHASGDNPARQGSVPASGSGSGPGSASGSMYGDAQAGHHHQHHHHNAGHHGHHSLASPVAGGHGSGWSPYGYPSASVYGGSPGPYGHPSHNTYSQYASGYGYPNSAAHHAVTAPPTPSAAGPAYHSSSMAGVMMHHGQQHGYTYGHQSHHMGAHTPTHPHTPHSHASPYFPVNGEAGHVNGSGALSSPSYTSAPQYSTQLPLAGRHRVTTTLWEDEGTLCFQVDARGVCVARRHDNNMINGTKLLNVCGMSRGKRDGILKNEKERIVVKVGAMHLKGVWISFQRGKQLAEQNGIADTLYPLFETNIQSFLYHPDNYPRTAAVMAAAQERHAQRQKVPGMPSPSALGGSQPPPLMRANTTPSNSLQKDQSAENGVGLNGTMAGASWNGAHNNSHPHDGHTSAPPTAHQSPASLHSHGQQQHLQMSLSGTSSPTLSQQAYGQASQGARPPPGDRRHSMPVTLANMHNHPGHSENPYGASNVGAANTAGGPAAATHRKVSGLKRSWNDEDDAPNVLDHNGHHLHGSSNPSPSEKEMQRTGSASSVGNGYKLEGENGIPSPSVNGRASKKSKQQTSQAHQSHQAHHPMHPMQNNVGI
ncbi:hypothetical protein IE53DRAFT_24000 [Violaceomyces palustris]|uniref:Uncharacterized protein n=1 Tax=Violaceomyces palustris TaxID=1673888 RepID=A0ACD0P7Z4_9BASI|nr:hypothetical protein IE53DRAFT_24000 [Violaceomyces palustris]